MKRVLFLLVAVLSGMTSACRDTETDTLSSPVASTEAGVRIVINGGERTAVPNVSGLYYTLDLTATNQEPVIDVITESESSKTVNLAPGVWNLDVEGYLCAKDAVDELILPVVRGNVANITVTGGEMTNVTVQLEAASPATGSGTLAYEVYFPASVDSAELTLTPYVGGEDLFYDLMPVYGGGGSKGTVELDAGYYRIAIALNGNDGKQVRQRDIVHIADKLETTASYSYTEADFAEPSTEDSEDDDEPISIGVNILSAAGWFETVYVKWETLALAESYEVYYKKSNDSEYTKVDDPLIRSYGTYYRADVMGIASGSYDIMVRPLLQDTVEGFIAVDEQRTVSVLSHDRSGFAFADGVVPGAYAADGTLKPNTRILYITDTNKDTVTLAVKTSASKEQTFTGLKAILLDAMQKGYEDRPLAVRFIGKVTNSGFTLEAGDIVIKDNGKNNSKKSYVTLEGIGNDAAAYGWGIRTQRASNVEIRNLAFMLTNSSGKDCFEAQNSEHLWIHNNDFFYGNAGGDSDQAKGDGAMDSKENTWMTYSYNHFWDTGKSSLLGNGTETPGYHTYHHNWFDHSDSRHPRVRNHYVHVYNNLYDGVAKYGIGAAANSPSIFVEANYFLNTKYPMLISMQGSDVANGNEGTFSSENGGIIKAYNNYMDAYSAGYFKPWSSSNTVEFDAYVVASRTETVPSTVTAKKGGAAYNNFDTGAQAAVINACLVDQPEAARTKVEEYAGRYYGGDFTFAFTDADKTNSDVNTSLKTALQNYAPGVVSIQGIDEGGGGGGDDPGNGDEGGDDPGNGDEGGGDDPGNGDDGGTIICHFTGKANSNSTVFTITGNYSDTKGKTTVDGTTYSDCLKMESSTNIAFTTTRSMTLTLYFASTETGKKVKVDGTSYTTDSDAKVSVDLAAGTHSITKGDNINLFYILLSE